MLYNVASYGYAALYLFIPIMIRIYMFPGLGYYEYSFIFLWCSRQEVTPCSSLFKEGLYVILQGMQSMDFFLLSVPSGPASEVKPPFPRL